MLSNGAMIGVCRAEHGSRGSEAAASSYLRHLTRGLSTTAASTPCSMAPTKSCDQHDSTLNTPTFTPTPAPTPASASSGQTSEQCGLTTDLLNDAILANFGPSVWTQDIQPGGPIVGLTGGSQQLASLGPGQQPQQGPKGEIPVELTQELGSSQVPGQIPDEQIVTIQVMPQQPVPAPPKQVDGQLLVPAQPNQSQTPPDKCSDDYRRRRAANNISCKKSRDKPKIELKKVKIELQKCEEERAKLESENVSLKAALSEAKQTQGLQREVTASESSPAAGLAPQESSDSGVESEDELVFKPKKKKTQMRLTTGGKHGMDGEIPVIVSDPPKSLSPEGLEIKILISGKAGDQFSRVTVQFGDD